MKSTVALVGAYAALAAAFTPGRHLHFPRSNGTTSSLASPAEITTVVVEETKTVTSCAPTITNCPAGKPEMSSIAESDRVVTTITSVVTTITCPVSDASSISSKIVEDRRTSSSLFPSSTTTPSFNSSALAPTAAPTATPTGTPAPVGPTTTLVLVVTSTLTSCAPTITNCPAGKPEMSSIAESDRVVTVTSTKTTITCPVSDASSISKEIVASQSASSALPGQKEPIRTTDIVSTKTTTITITISGKPTVVPTVITTTFKSTITPPAADDQTVTETRTSTKTKTVTISRVKPTNTAVPSSGGNNGSGGSGGNLSGCEHCAAPVTVTVTVAQTTVTASAATVTVTAPCVAGAVPSDNKAVEKPKPSDESNLSAKPSAVSQTPVEDSDIPCPTDSTTTIEATVTVVPFPVGNGTTPTGTGVAKPSGFASLRH